MDRNLPTYKVLKEKSKRKKIYFLQKLDVNVAVAPVSSSNLYFVIVTH